MISPLYQQPVTCVQNLHFRLIQTYEITATHSVVVLPRKSNLDKNNVLKDYRTSCHLGSDDLKSR
jgi:hypothetical protein